MADQSFRALVYSLIVHIIVAIMLLRAPSHFETTSSDAPIEITVMEKPNKKQSFVVETAERESDLLDALKKKADYLSQFTKRVKEQMRARNSGETKNRPGQANSESDEERAQGQAGVSADPRQGQALNLPGVGPRNRGDSGSSPFGKQVVVGASTVGEYIPGVKEGAFTALNTDRFTYYTFFARINEQVRSRWIGYLRQVAGSLSNAAQVELANRERITEVDVQIDLEGQFVRALIMRSSGSKDLDTAAAAAFRDAAPFPNPPKELVEADGLIHLRYGFIVQWSPNQLAVGR